MVDDRSDGDVASGSSTGVPQAGADGSGHASGDLVVVPVEGELDALNSEQLRTTLAAAFDGSPAAVGVDLSRRVFVDSGGLSGLEAAHNRGVAEGVPFQIRSASPACLRVLEITRLVDVLDLR